jgi:hypothetical protein
MANPTGAFDRYSIYPCRIGDIELTQIHDVRISPNSNKSEITPGGGIDRQHIATAHSEPTVKILTSDFETVFANVDIGTGYCSNTDSAETAASIFQFQRREDCGTFDGAGNATHQVATGQKGFTACESIHAEQDSLEGAQIDLNHWALSEDGYIEPLEFSKIALELTTTFVSLYHLGPVYLNAVQWLGVQNITVRPGIVYQEKRMSGNPFAQIGSIVARNPEILIRFNDLDTNFTGGNLSNLFHNANNETLHIYLWHSLHGGSRSPLANNVHVHISANYSEMTPDTVSVARIDDTIMEAKFRVTQGPLVLALAQAIPA